VTRFVHRADIQKNTLEAKVRIHNPSELLKPDMLARVRILQPTALEGERVTRTVPRIFVPQEAIQADGTVFIIDQYERGSGLAARRTVVLGPSIIDDWQEVLSGLKAGDRVILDATSDLDGAHVWLAEPEGN
jgi:multidrug efflux pump subunit AcrA (membrane-fusion protein)